MKKFFQKIWQAIKSNKKWAVVAAALGAALGLFHLLKFNADLMTWYVDTVTGPVKRFFAYLLSFTRYSVAEWLIIAAALAAAAFVVISAVRIIRHKGERLKRIVGFLLKSTSLVLAVALSMALLWGANYYARDFKTRSGLHPDEYTQQQLYDTAALFAERIGETAGLVDRDQNGLFDYSISDMFARSKTLFDNIEQVYPFLGGRDLMPKQIVFSRFMSRAHTTGVTFPYTGEANINVDQPAFLIPATIAHEFAHQRNVASEQEANFVAILACELSGDAAFAYSGYMLGFIYLSNALAREDAELYYEVMALLPEGALLDLAARYEYWLQFQGRLAEVSNNMYDGFLQGYGEPLGTKSYGAVVDLLILYYCPTL